MDYHLITHNGVYFIHSDDMTIQNRKTRVQIDAERRAFILSGKRQVPNEECHYCGTRVPKLAHWCSSGCAEEYDAEKAELVARGGR